MTPNQLANVRRIMKETRARRRAAANLAADRRDAAHFAVSARARVDGMRPIEHAMLIRLTPTVSRRSIWALDN